MSLVAFILGAGGNVGAGVARLFAAKGYTVVVASRSAKPIEGAKHVVKFDITQPSTIPEAFAAAEKAAGAPPNVVVFNASALTPGGKDVVSAVKHEDVARDATFGTNGLYAAIQSAVSGFRRGPATTPKAFIYTGNILPFITPHSAFLFTSGLIKISAAYQVQLFSNVFRDEGFRFYFASQISPSGGPVSMAKLSGEAHAKAYWNLVQRKEQGEWDIRFFADGSEGPKEPVHLNFDT